MAKPFLISPLADFVAKSTTQPTAMLAADEVCSSFQVVSESTPMPPQGRRTKLLIGSWLNLEMSNFWNTKSATLRVCFVKGEFHLQIKPQQN
jgi:hypothetical protein